MAPFHRTNAALVCAVGFWYSGLAESPAFGIMWQDDSEVQVYGIHQPWGIKGGRARPSFVVSKSGFSGGRNRNLPPERLFGFFLAAQKETRIRRCVISSGAFFQMINQENGDRIACTINKYAGERHKNRVKTRNARPQPRNLCYKTLAKEKPKNKGRIACTESRYAGET